MIRKIISTAAFCLAVFAVQAQDRCVIKGEFTGPDSLRFTPQRIEKVYLSAIDEFDRSVRIDSAKVVDRKFTFTYDLKAGEPILIHLIEGFDNGAISLFLEPGEISVKIADGRFPVGATITGTPNNELFGEYNKIQKKCVQFQTEGTKHLKLESKETETQDALIIQMYLGGAALFQNYADIMRLIYEHSDSPYSLMLLHRIIMPAMSDRINQRLVKTVSPKLFNHPYYKAYSNAVLAANMRVGELVPDILMPTVDGKQMHLSDLRGKYVLLDFWASWCGPCRREMPNVIRVFEEAQGKENFAMVSFSLDNKEADWKKGIDTFNINREGWIHASDLYGWGSPAAKLMGVEAVPKTILIDPEGRAIAFDLRGDELVQNVRKILSGDLYYMQGGDSAQNGALEEIRLQK